MLFASSDDAFRSEAYCLMLASGLLCSSDKQRNPATSSSSVLVLESRSAVCFFLAVARADSTDTTATSTPNKKDRFLKTGELMTSLVHCQSPSHTNRSLMHKKWRPKPPFCQNSWLASSEALVVVARGDDVDVFHNSLLCSLKKSKSCEGRCTILSLHLDAARWAYEGKVLAQPLQAIPTLVTGSRKRFISYDLPARRLFICHFTLASHALHL